MIELAYEYWRTAETFWRELYFYADLFFQQIHPDLVEDWATPCSHSFDLEYGFQDLDNDH